MKFYGELLVFILLFITNFRVFFVKSARHDPLVVLAPFTFTIALLQIFSFGIEVFTVLGFIIALLVLLSNFHAIFRYSENLYIDHYSPLMMIWAIITSILSAAAIAGIIIFAPLELNSRKLNIMESQTRLKGNFRTGFSSAASYSPADAFLYKFEPIQKIQEEEKSEEVVIFFPDKLGNTEHYKPYLQLLASKGFTVYSADFYADDCRWLHSIEDMKILRRLAMLIRSEVKPSFFASQREFYTYNISLEINAMISLLSEKYGNDSSFYLVSDIMGNTAISDFTIKQKSKVKDFFFLNSVPEYETSGYGFIKQTDPLFSFYKGLEWDKNFSEAKILAEKTAEHFAHLAAKAEENTEEEAS
ncbi:MAG: hypothetical protein IJ688_04060 [Treponema sp.]|nr:hypothetical protein [Treponema sp.]